MNIIDFPTKLDELENVKNIFYGFLYKYNLINQPILVIDDEETKEPLIIVVSSKKQKVLEKLKEIS